MMWNYLNPLHGEPCEEEMDCDGNRDSTYCCNGECTFKECDEDQV